MKLIEVGTASGSSRRCDAVCHDAKGSTCQCVCGGRFHGITSERAERVTPEELFAVRETMELAPDEHVQLRLGA